jgi:hypothetical protein
MSICWPGSRPARPILPTVSSEAGLRAARLRPGALAAALLALALCFGPAGAQTDPLFPAVDCAALWAAMATFRQVYAVDLADPGEAREMAGAFRDAAVRLNGGGGDGIDRTIARLRRAYVLLLEAYMLDGDRDSQDQYDWLMETCRRFAEEYDLPGHRDGRRGAAPADPLQH